MMVMVQSMVDSWELRGDVSAAGVEGPTAGRHVIGCELPGRGCQARLKEDELEGCECRVLKRAVTGEKVDNDQDDADQEEEIHPGAKYVSADQAN